MCWFVFVVSIVFLAFYVFWGAVWVCVAFACVYVLCIVFCFRHIVDLFLCFCCVLAVCRENLAEQLSSAMFPAGIVIFLLLLLFRMVWFVFLLFLLCFLLFIVWPCLGMCCFCMCLCVVFCFLYSSHRCYVFVFFLLRFG